MHACMDGCMDVKLSGVVDIVVASPGRLLKHKMEVCI